MKMLLTHGLLAFTLFGLSPPALAEVSAAETQMMDAVDAGYEDSITLLEKLVNQNSGTHNFEGVRAVGEMVRPELEALGFHAEWIDQDAAGRAGHLVARHVGKAGTTKMLLIAHLDTVFEPNSSFQSFSRDGDKASGPGANDDKGGIVIILNALSAMKTAGRLQDANIIVFLTGDEESAGSPLEVSRADLRKAAEWADVALDFEGLAIQDGVDMGSIARRSSNSWTVTATGREGHSSRVFSDASGYGAIYELSRILNEFREQLPEEDLTYNVGLIAGGSQATVEDDGLNAQAYGKGNIIAPIAVAKGDLRTISQEQTERVVERMASIVADHLPGTGAAIEFTFRYPPMPPTDGNKLLLGKLNAINVDMGLAEMPILPPAMRGAGDINFVADLVDGLAGLGPAGGGAHAPGETIDLNSIKRQSKRAAILMSRLAAETPK
jgi:glutamate carboxypeptidase